MQKVFLVLTIIALLSISAVAQGPNYEDAERKHIAATLDRIVAQEAPKLELDYESDEFANIVRRWIEDDHSITVDIAKENSAEDASKNLHSDADVSLNGTRSHLEGYGDETAVMWNYKSSVVIRFRVRDMLVQVNAVSEEKAKRFARYAAQCLASI